MNPDTWEPFRAYADRGSAEAIAVALESDGVPARVEPIGLEVGIDGAFRVVVLSSLAHRARWILAQLPPSDAELEFLAIGRLPGEE